MVVKVKYTEPGEREVPRDNNVCYSAVPSELPHWGRSSMGQWFLILSILILKGYLVYSKLQEDLVNE